MRKHIKTCLFCVFCVTMIIMVPILNEAACIKSSDIKIDINVSLPNRGEVNINNGIGYSSDGGGAIDWEHTIKNNILLHGQYNYRVIKIESSHKTGSGFWGHIIVANCIDNVQSIIFSKSFLGEVKVIVKDNNEIILKYGVWGQGDAECCPSNENISTYKFDNNTGSMVLINTYTNKLTK